MTNDGERRAPLGEWLRELRASAQLSQEELADRIGSTRREVMRWESGAHEPKAGTLLRWMQETGAKVSPPPPGAHPSLDERVAEVERDLRTLLEIQAANQTELLATLRTLREAIALPPGEQRMTRPRRRAS